MNCARCDAELIERPGLRVIRFFECRVCWSSFQIRVEAGRKFALRSLLLLPAPGASHETAEDLHRRRAIMRVRIDAFLAKYVKEEETDASGNLCEGEYVEQRAGSEDADARAARAL